MIIFEYDPDKSAANLAKHGIDFVDAQALWLDDSKLVLPVMSEPEQRFLAIGKIGDKCWTAVFTPRGENIRLISCRRSRKTEEAIYEDHNN